MIIFRCDASGDIGFGHLRRCLILARALQARAQNLVFVVPDTQTDLIDMIKQDGYAVHIVPGGLHYAEEVAFYPEKFKHCIVDLGFRDNLQHPHALIVYLQALVSAGYKVAMIDGLDDDCFRFDEMPVISAVIQPYWGVKDSPPKAGHWLSGPDYVLLAEEYASAFRDRRDCDVCNIVVSFGGADPQGYSVDALRGLLEGAAVRADHKIRVIAGPFFSQSLLESLAGFEARGVEVVHAPKDMIAQYDWADLIVCGSGTTRYEAAACGVPIVFAAIYPEHETLCQNFASYGTGHYVGLASRLRPDDWAEAFAALQGPSDSIIKMRQVLSQMTGTGQGAQNLAQKLIRIFNA